MSYDLYVVRRDIPENFWDYGYDPDYDYGCYFNYTYNLGPFFAAYQFTRQPTWTARPVGNAPKS